MIEIIEQRIKKKSKELGQMFFPDDMNPWARPNWEAGYVESACEEMATFALQNQWISVEEELPGYGKDVFVRFISRFPNNSEEYEIGYCTRWRTKDKTVKTDSNGFSIIGDMEITHWMEIPQLLKGDNNE